MNEEIKSILIKSGLKITQARCALLEILLKNNTPQNYEQIKSSLNMDKSTFYRNMQAFEKKGIVNKFESWDRVWHYEIGKSNHAHFMCEICSQIECLDLEIPKKLQKYEISSITLKGKCKNCIEKS